MPDSSNLSERRCKASIAPLRPETPTPRIEPLAHPRGYLPLLSGSSRGVIVSEQCSVSQA